MRIIFVILTLLLGPAGAAAQRDTVLLLCQPASRDEARLTQKICSDVNRFTRNVRVVERGRAHVNLRARFDGQKRLVVAWRAAGFGPGGITLDDPSDAQELELASSELASFIHNNRDAILK